ncbi:MAG: hypothetical protein HC866_11915 [Leptolyngbyaceae cyanobacterium RU_5_1]|nr:hypothetical protein [Leptolyngbyaceae cyanobacterium RU_5_1]
MFIWKGKGVRLRVRDYNQRRTILWTQPVTNQEQQRYTGQAALQPGQLYQWQISMVEAAPSRRSPVQENWETFRIMPADQRQDIAIALRTLEQPQASPEMVALRKAEFLPIAVSGQMRYR